MITHFKMIFNIYGLILFFIIMIPNILWVIFPSKNDVLRKDSITKNIDKLMSIAQVLMIASLVFISNKNIAAGFFDIKNLWVLVSVICILAYFTSWIAYYLGNVSNTTIMSLCLFPCFAFVCYEISIQNWIALIPTIIYTLCHIVYSLKNYVILKRGLPWIRTKSK